MADRSAACPEFIEGLSTTRLAAARETDPDGASVETGLDSAEPAGNILTNI